MTNITKLSVKDKLLSQREAERIMEMHGAGSGKIIKRNHNIGNP